MPQITTGVQDGLSRIGEHLVDRPGGPMSFRFILQPVMASILGVRAR